jgi:hypothetical protein
VQLGISIRKTMPPVDADVDDVVHEYHIQGDRVTQPFDPRESTTNGARSGSLMQCSEFYPALVGRDAQLIATFVRTRSTHAKSKGARFVTRRESAGDARVLRDTRDHPHAKTLRCVNVDASGIARDATGEGSERQIQRSAAGRDHLWRERAAQATIRSTDFTDGKNSCKLLPE